MRYPTVIRLAALSILAAASAATAGAQAQASITVDATKAVRLVDERVFGMNTAVWDGAFGEPQTLVVLQQTDTRFLRYPGGSSSDQYHWQTNSDTAGNSAGSTNFDVFAKTAQAISAQVVITANYGTGTAQEAAAWVTYSNVTKGYGFKYWEIGNECYGTWEDDATAYPHDPYTYATRAVQYIKAMKAVDPTIKIGVPVVTGEDSNSNGYTSHTVTNPVTNVTHNGWTPVVLATMKSLGVLPDFVCYHRYEQNSGQENDSNLLQTALTWPNDAVNLRGMLNDYLSSSGASVEILCTENNSVNTNPGKQSVSIVDGLYMLDSIGNIMKTEINSLVWWALHNGQNTSGYNSSALYGWREYGDYGIEQGDSSATDSIAHDPYPTFFAMKLLKYFARQGDTVISASSSDPLLSVFAAHRLDDSLSLLIVNKNASVTFTTTISLNGYTPQATAKVYSYGVTQDSAAEAASAPPTQGSAAATLVSSWENSMDGWVNQSGPNDVAHNYGLEGPYLYSIAYSTATGVTDGTTSLACTAASNPGYWNVLQNSQQSMATTLSTASTISLDVYPSFFSGVSGSSYALVTLYLNGSGIDYQTLDWGTLKVNQENTVTWTLTAAQQAGIAASIGTGQWFQVGIIINTNNPLTAYFDNFRVTSGSGSAPPTPPETNPSLDIAVSTISTASASFTTSIGPYTAEVISLTKSAITTQPSDQYAAVGGSVTFSVTASGSSTLSYQWNFNGTPIAGATGSSYTISNVSASNAGPYTVTVTDAAGSVTSSTANLYVNTGSSGARLINISTRAQVGTGANILIPGFVIGGSGTETLLIRADGPGLTQFNVTGVLAQPILTVFNSAGTAVASNTGWGTNLNPSQIASVAAQVGAFALAPNSADCALIANLGPGSYTVQVSGVGNTTGVALAEVYEVSSTGTSLINISTRAQVGTGGNILIPGFVIGGSGTMQLLVRGDGPGLTQFNVTGVLAQPSLGVFNSIGTEIASNTGWGTASNPSQIASVATFVGAFALTPGSADCAQIVNLQPGGYTIQISGVNSTTGVALAEVYAVP